MPVIIDFETRSRIDLQKSGAWVYGGHKSTEILCMGYKVDNQPATLWKPGEPLPDFMQDPNIEVIAHNVLFEYCTWNIVGAKRYGFPIKESNWQCTMRMALALGLPRSLAALGTTLKLPIQKDAEGHRIMLKLCKPRKPSKHNKKEWFDDPEDFEKLYQYCLHDIETEKLAYDYLVQHAPDLTQEKDIIDIDWQINARGVRVDNETVQNALAILDKTKTDLNEELTRITNGFVTSANQRAKLMKWCQDQGCELNTYDADAVRDALKEESLPANVKRVLEIRQTLSKSSTAKYKRLQQMVASDNRVHGLFNYHGTITGRWSSNGVQLHNLPRGNTHITDIINMMKHRDPEWLNTLYDDAMVAASKCLRGVFCAPEDKLLLGGDFNAIETRVLWWLVGEKKGLQLFKEKLDPYKDMAASIYRRPIHTITKEERQLGKVTILGCGYGMGPEKFKDTCTNWDIDISLEMATHVVKTYRQHYQRVKSFWNHIEEAIIYIVATKKTAWSRAGKLEAVFINEFLKIKLPSGRCLHYYKPHLKPITTPWGSKKKQLCYEGVDSITGANGVISTYGGKLTENIVQAIARDLLAEALCRLNKHNFDIVLHVHDEVVCEINKTNKQEQTKQFETIMNQPPTWCADLPLKVSCWTDERYTK